MKNIFKKILHKEEKLKTVIKIKKIISYDLISSPSFTNSSMWFPESDEQRAERIRNERNEKLKSIFD